jgi:hypothetical protein
MQSKSTKHVTQTAASKRDLPIEIPFDLIFTHQMPNSKVEKYYYINAIANYFPIILVYV